MVGCPRVKMIIETIEDFCGSGFWELNTTWNTASPDFSPCFEQTVLVWVPCLFVFIFSPIEFFYIRNSKCRNIPWNFKNVSKLVAVGLLEILCIADYIDSTIRDDAAGVDVLTPFIKFCTFCFVGVLTIYNKKHGLRASGLLFLFWLLTLVSSSARFRTLIIEAASVQQISDLNYSWYSYMVYYALVFFSFILHFFADEAPLYSEYPPAQKPCPENASSIPSRITCTWFQKLAWLGYKRTLTEEDLFQLNFEDTCAAIIPLFEHYWNKSVKQAMPEPPTTKVKYTQNSVKFQATSKKKKKASVLPALVKAFGPMFLFGAFFKLLDDLLSFVSPQILKLLIAFVSGHGYMWRGFFYAVLLSVTAVCQSMVSNQYFLRMNIIGMRIRTALVSAIYKKSLRLSSAARRETTVGEIVNLMAVDAQSFLMLMLFICMLWSAPFQICLSLYFLWQILGPSVLAGVAVMVIMVPVNAVIVNVTRRFQIRQMKFKDQRIKLINEVLAGMKVLKLYAWEQSFQKQVEKIRNKEIHVLKKAAYLSAVSSILWSCIPFFVSLSTFAVYVLIDDSHILDAEKIFVSMSLFNVLRFPLVMLPIVVSNLAQASVSIRRINRFMNAEELDPDAVTKDENEKDPVVVENGTFSWDTSEERQTLKNINMSIKQGSLVAIVGTVGCGKSSLISALLGEMHKISGRVNVKGTKAYVPQQAWIQNATLKDNILFGNTLSNSKYQKIVKACALQQDFDMLPGGDMTEIGEKGINLSGGQKQRISLARAVYSESDIYLLDDPLSAVDSHVGKHIFENVIGPKGILRKKVRVLVTHAITYLPQVDHIFVINDGQISESGSYKELLAKKGSFAEFLVQHLQDDDEEEEDSIEISEIKHQLIEADKELAHKLTRRFSTRSSTNSTSSLHRQISSDSRNGDVFQKQEKKDKLVDVEKSETGVVKWSVYTYYLKSFGMFLTIVTLVMNIIYQAAVIGGNFWLSAWSSDTTTVINGTQDINKRDMYLEVYGVFGIVQAISKMICSLSLNFGCLIAAQVLHKTMLSRLMHAPMSFFDTTPTGRIVNRFSKDIDTLDNTLPFNLSMFYNVFLSLIGTLFVISYSTPVFILVIIPFGLLNYFLQRFYVATSRQLKRMESVSRSPVYSHFSETISGAQSIRAYQVQNTFIKQSEEKVDFNQLYYYPSVIANRWLAVRLEFAGNIVIFFAALFAVLARDTMNPGLVGLSLTYALQITMALNMVIRNASDIETNVVAVERIKEYSEVPQEAVWEVDPKPGNDWPQKGHVEFVDYKVRYRPGLDLVLKGISFHVNGGEKIGIVGRTGAGKSSLTLCLFRILEAAGGNILIDGVDISKIGLHDLRSCLTIIPQDPVLFSGTLRMNLDPFERANDITVWQALELAHLKNFVKDLSSGLQYVIAEGGDNLSVGQRQLVCLSRALLRKTKVLILDEATAAVDLETDDLIQKTIRSEFKDCTVLTIAHRLNTIMDSDRVIVLDRGEIVEFDSPTNLLRSDKTVFYSMAKDAGLC